MRVGGQMGRWGLQWGRTRRVEGYVDRLVVGRWVSGVQMSGSVGGRRVDDRQVDGKRDRWGDR